MQQGMTMASPYDRACTNQTVNVADMSEPKAACVYTLEDGSEYIEESGARYMKKQSDSLFVPLYRKNTSQQLQGYSGSFQFAPHSETVVMQPSNFGGKIEIINHFTQKIQLVQHEGNDVYEVPPASDFLLINSSGSPENGYGLGSFSRNGQFFVTKNSSGAVIRINLTDFSQKTIGNVGTFLSVGLGVSNDGKYIANLGFPYKVMRVEGTCGTVFADLLTEIDECPARNYDEFLQPIFGDAIYTQRTIFSSSIARFETDTSFTIYRPQNGQWQTFTFSYSRDGEPEELNLPTGKRLKYLALGDSYSSGEGDIELKSDGSTYYLPGTENRDECHLSERSYPFLLRDAYDIPHEDMASVACSGAKILPDYMSYDPNKYRGQIDRVKEMSDQQRSGAREEALKNLSPGVLPQIEFVRQYRPEVITLTGGGNDIGFEGILRYCASPETTSITMHFPHTCELAKDNSPQREMLHDIIDTQYELTGNFINRLRIASPASKIILVGYPSFISENEYNFCSLNSATLNAKERTMIDETLKYLNKMLRRVASDYGITYVDVENSLHGGRLCEGSDYVTGFTDIGGEKIDKGDVQESFHPNAAGHQKLAQKIKTSNAFQNFETEEYFDYEPREFMITTYSNELVAGSHLIQSGELGFARAGADAFDPGSQFDLNLYSDPVHLGTYEAADDGSFETGIETARLPIGNHLLVATGTLNGAPVKYYQYVQIWASENDHDGDGIANEYDSCEFLLQWYDETSQRDLCAGGASVPPVVPTDTTSNVSKILNPSSSPFDSLINSDENESGSTFQPEKFSQSPSGQTNDTQPLKTNGDERVQTKSNSYLQIGVVFGLFAVTIIGVVVYRLSMTRKP